MANDYFEEFDKFFTTGEMFDMIEDFAQEMLDYLREHGEEGAGNRELMADTSKEIVKIFKSRGINLNLGIVVALNAACAMYTVALEHADQSKVMPPCPNDLLN